MLLAPHFHMVTVGSGPSARKRLYSLFFVSIEWQLSPTKRTKLTTFGDANFAEFHTAVPANSDLIVVELLGFPVQSILWVFMHSTER